MIAFLVLYEIAPGRFKAAADDWGSVLAFARRGLTRMDSLLRTRRVHVSPMNLSAPASRRLRSCNPGTTAP